MQSGVEVQREAMDGQAEPTTKRAEPDELADCFRKLRAAFSREPFAIGSG